MKKATHKILMAAASLVIALGVASGTTFAWFTSNRTVTVGTIEAEVVSGNDGLYVAILKKGGSVGTAADFGWYDGDTFNAGFKNTLTTNSITKATTDANTTVKLDALTSMVKPSAEGAAANSNGYQLVKENGVASEAVTYQFGADAENKVENNFLEFTVKFRTTVAQTIYLATTNGATSPVESDIDYGTFTDQATNAVKAWKALSADTYGAAVESGASILARAADAARVSFNPGTYSSSWAAPANGTNAKVWAPYDYDSVLGNGEAGSGRGFYKNNLAADYIEYFLNDNPDASSTRTPVLNQVKTVDYATAKDAANSSAISAAQGTPLATTVQVGGAYEAVVTIRLWLEGTDGDCMNSIFSDHLILQLVFTSVRTAA